MKTLQNNFTTPEQSKRLLELGVPVESADGYYTNFSDETHAYFPNYICQRDKEWWDAADVTASWSVGRLIEIYNICCYVQPMMDLDFSCAPEEGTYIEMLVTAFELADELSDFSKLED